MLSFNILSLRNSIGKYRENIWKNWAHLKFYALFLNTCVDHEYLSTY